MNLYMRKISLIAGRKTIEPPLTIYFDVPFDDSAEVNDVEITVYNLKDSTVNSIKKGDRFVLTAGYQDDAGTIFQGILQRKETTWEGVDKITKFYCIDDEGQYMTKKIKKTFERGTTASTILKYLIGESGLSIGEMKLPKDFIYRSGKTINAKISTIMLEIAKDCHAKIHVNRNKIFIRDKNKGDESGIVVSKETGLIDEPEEISDEIDDVQKKEKKQRKGYKVRMLINNRITVDTIFTLKSKKVNGRFRVEKGRHTHNGQPFYTEVEVYPA